MKCPNCGQENRIRETDKYCFQCGASLKDDNKSIRVEVSLDTEQAEAKASELIGLIEKANSLADELADSIKNLEFNIKI